MSETWEGRPQKFVLEGKPNSNTEKKVLDPEVQSLLSSVSDALQERAGKDVFAIGGKVTPPDVSSTDTPGKGPLVIRWESGDHHSKLVLPVGAEESSQASFAQLLKDCQPATFGMNNKDVYDEKYRKASKLDEADFCTSFNPYEHGVIDTIVQALAYADHSDSANLGIRAELYKFNVYSAPSGMFKPHVDTPRSADQMGSLVVCLPYAYQGGELLVRHGGREIIFDWSSKEPSAIQWAAFFSDCEHEVAEVTEGHRLTLTYNLYWTSYGPAKMAARFDAIEYGYLHFFESLKKLLAEPKFLPKGGRLAFTCTHAYPHSSKPSIQQLHHTLKGIDMVVYQALKQLTGQAYVVSVIDDEAYQEFQAEEHGAPLPTRSREARLSNAYMSKGRLEPPVEFADFAWDRELPDPAKVTKHTVVTRCDREMENEFLYPRREVAWLNYSPGSENHRELAVIYMLHGNEAYLESYYSWAVIMAKVKRDNQGSDSEDE